MRQNIKNCTYYDRFSPYFSCGKIFHLTTCHGENFSTRPIFLHRRHLWCLWQIWGMPLPPPRPPGWQLEHIRVKQQVHNHSWQARCCFAIIAINISDRCHFARLSISNPDTSFPLHIPNFHHDFIKVRVMKYFCKNSTKPAIFFHRSPYFVCL